MHFVYIVRCKGNRLYIGYTNDMQRRWQEHKDKSPKAKFTRAFPVESIALLIATEESKELALKMEAQLKKYKKAEKEEIIRNPRSFLSKNPQFTQQDHSIF